jgi:predicted dehydrogenase
MARKIRIGMIGYGYWGPNLTRNFAELAQAELVAVADQDLNRLNSVRTRYPNITLTQDYTDLFKMDLDACVVATPPQTHYTIARDCLEHGLHTLVEKPLTLESKTSFELYKLAHERDLRLMVGHTFLYNSTVRALKDLIDEGEFGNIFYMDAVRVNLGLYQKHCDVMWDLAPHDISIFMYLMGEVPNTVSASGGSFLVPNKHDVAYLSLSFPSGKLAHIHASWINPNKERRITIVGNKKMAVYDDLQTVERIKIFDKGVDAPPYTDTFADFQFSYRYGDVISPYIDFIEPLRVEAQHFVDCIVNHWTPLSDGKNGLDVVRILEAADKSIALGGATVECSQYSLDEEVRVPAAI